MVTRFKYFLSDESGATAIEYGLIAGLIALGLIGGLNLLAGGNDSLWGNVQTEVDAVL